MSNVRNRKHRRLYKMRIVARKCINAHRANGGRTGSVHEKQMKSCCPNNKKKFRCKLLKLRDEMRMNNIIWGI